MNRRLVTQRVAPGGYRLSGQFLGAVPGAHVPVRQRGPLAGLTVSARAYRRLLHSGRRGCGPPFGQVTTA